MKQAAGLRTRCQFIAELSISRRFFQYHFPHICRVDRNPSMLTQGHLHTAGLPVRRPVGGHAKTLFAEV